MSPITIQRIGVALTSPLIVLAILGVAFLAAVMKFFEYTALGWRELMLERWNFDPTQHPDREG